MRLIELIIMAMFDVVGYIIISKRLINHNKLNKLLCGICILVFSIIIGINGGYISAWRNFFIGGILICCINYLLYKIEIIEIIYVYILSTIIVISTQLLSIVLLEFLIGKVEYTFTYGMVSQIISLIIITFISEYIPIHLMFRFISKNNKVFKLLILNLLVLLVSILSYWYMDIDGILENIISMAVLSIGVILVNFVLLKNGLRNEFEEQQLQIYEKYLPVIDELINELRTRQHEFDNHIQALKMLTITSTDYESIISSMKSYINDLEISNDLRDLVKLDNKILAGFLYSKISNAKKLGIKFRIIIEDYQFKLDLMDYELIEIMGNLINNAFETKVEDNSVILILSKEKDMNVIELRNKHPYLKRESIDNIFSMGFSTKSHAGRGYGLYNIKEIVKKYNGKIEILNELYYGENHIVFRILFAIN
ncbi:GHKL domain-containing protein [Tissierella sp. MSJ-40]|uniref:GHKL domain-containing protein n=1 Tax=Tissierella simiarum TaxID=2841534 RepID=A0ABS6E7I2_9FIRM|nr:ATP-binding protein [Tissierella simiarum]MBU5438868.1 GHKL domain-containing protein [Tissierella simiarum]